MHDTGYSDDELRARFHDLFSQAAKIKARRKLMEETSGRHLGNDPDYQKLERQMLNLVAEAFELRESGQIPWIEDNGMGNDTDSGADEVQVWARRVYDRYLGDRGTGSDGRAIELRVLAGHGQFGQLLTLKFTKPETVQAVIDQLQTELDGWGDWDGTPAEM